MSDRNICIHDNINILVIEKYLHFAQRRNQILGPRKIQVFYQYLYNKNNIDIQTRNGDPLSANEFVL